MERIFHEYTEWEDYKRGMYETKNIEKDIYKKSLSLLKNIEKLKKTCQKVFDKWPIATEENLTNDQTNKIAWLGQACCCYEYGVPEIETKKAWNMLDEFSQFRANKAVGQMVQVWVDRNNKINNGQLDIYGKEN
jgi:hypothetical protein